MFKKLLFIMLGSPRVDGDDDEDDVDDLENEFNSELSASSRRGTQQPIPLLTHRMPVSQLNSYTSSVNATINFVLHSL